MASIKLDSPTKRKIVLQIWTIPIIFFILITAGLIVFYYWSVNKKAEVLAQSDQLQKQHQEINERINKIKIEEQEIIAKSTKFINLAKNRVINSANQLDIQEYLFSQAKLNGIGKFEYAFAEKGKSWRDLKKMIKIDQDQKNPPPSPIRVSVLPLTMKFDVLHEIQFFNFLTSLNQNFSSQKSNLNINPHSLAQINKCKIKRINPNADLSPIKNNFSAECLINWLNFEITPS